MYPLYTPAQLVKQLGVKMLAYGPPGTAKTPICITAPRPIFVSCETGLGALRENTTLPCASAYTWKDIKGFFDWFFASREADQFDTLCLDSGSQMCEIKLKEDKLVIKDNRQLYGSLIDAVKPIFTALYYMPRKHVYIIAQEEEYDQPTGFGTSEKAYRPYFPGNAVPTYVRHLYDVIMRAEFQGTMPGQPPMFRTLRTATKEARDRFGVLSEYEPMNLSNIISKIMTKGK